MKTTNNSPVFAPQPPTRSPLEPMGYWAASTSAVASAPASTGMAAPVSTTASAPMPTRAQAFAAAEANATTPTTVPTPVLAQTQLQSQPAMQETVEQRSDSFSRASSALVMLGLVMLGGAIAPLLAFFQVQIAAKYFIGLAYLIVCCLTVTWLVGRMFRHSARRDAHVRATRIGVLMVGELALLAFTMACAPFALRWEITLCVLAATMVVLNVAVPAQKREAAYTPLRVNECLVMVVLAMIFPETSTWGHIPVQTLIAYTVALVLSAVVVALHTKELASADASPKAHKGWLLVGTSFAITLLVAAYVLGCMPFGDSPYAYDVVFMTSALVCAGLGFHFCEPALRRTGLAFALMTIVKMTTIDTIGFDPLPKAIAYLVGGAVCFAIGGMYSYAVKRMSAAK